MDNKAGHLSNRDRFFEIIRPIFETSSHYEIKKADTGKYKDKIIQIINKGSGTHDFHIWCHIRDDRLDIVVPEFRINQIPEKIGLKKRCANIHKDVRLDGQDAVSFQQVEEDILVDVCRYLATHIV